MTTLTVSLPEALTLYLQEQIAAGHYSSTDDYIQALIQRDKANREHLEPLILEGLDSGEPTPMTQEDWATVRAAVSQNSSDQPQHG